jgi:hypothetical protein
VKVFCFFFVGCNATKFIYTHTYGFLQESITIPRGSEGEMDTLELILPEDQSCKRRVSWTHQAGYSGNSFSIKLPTVYRDILHLKEEEEEKKTM